MNAPAYALTASVIGLVLHVVTLRPSGPFRDPLAIAVWTVSMSSFITWQWQRRYSLTISPEGVVYAGNTLIASVPWDEIAGVARVQSRVPWRRREGLLLAGLYYGLPSYAVTFDGHLTEGQIVPLDLFDPRWRTGAIGDDLRRHSATVP